MATSPPTYRRARIGGVLRRLREQRGMTLEDVATAVGVGIDRINRIELGRVRIDLPVLRALLDVYGVRDPEVRAALEDTVRNLTQRTWWQTYSRSLHLALQEFLGLEHDAISVATWQPTLIPGRLQSKEFARALLQAGVGIVHDSAERVDALVAVRMERQRTVSSPLTAIIGAAALNNVIGDSAVMRRQISHLLDRSEGGVLDLRVLPVDRGPHVGLDGAFTVMQFPDGGQLAAVETLVTTSYLDDEESLTAYGRAIDQLTSLALDQSASRAHLEQAARAL